MSSSQLNKLKLGIKHGYEITSKISSNVFGRKIRRILSRLLGPLLKPRLPLIGNAIKPLAKSVLIPLGLTVAALTTNTDIHNKMFGSSMTRLIISNEEMNDIIKIVQLLEEFGLLIKGVNKTIKNGAKEQIGGFIGVSLGSLGASLLGNLLTG